MLGKHQESKKITRTK